jgi:hypothetical protein
MANKVIPVRQSPQVAEGMGVTEFLNDSVESISTDLVNYNDTSPENLLTVPANVLVVGVIVEVITGFDKLTPSCTLGTSGTPAMLVGVNDYDITTAGFYHVATKPSKFTSATTLQATIVSNSGTQGQLRFWVLYRSRTKFLA